mgnify:CR=1 FL=1
MEIFFNKGVILAINSVKESRQTTNSATAKDNRVAMAAKRKNKEKNKSSDRFIFMLSTQR